MDEDLLGQDEDLLKDLPQDSAAEKIVRGTTRTLPSQVTCSICRFWLEALGYLVSVWLLP